MDYKAKLTLLRHTTEDLVIRRFLDALLNPPNPSTLQQATISPQEKIDLIDKKASFAALSPTEYVDYMFMEEPERLKYIRKNLPEIAQKLGICVTYEIPNTPKDVERPTPIQIERVDTDKIQMEIRLLQDLQIIAEVNDIKTFVDIDEKIVEMCDDIDETTKKKRMEMIDIRMILKSLQLVEITSPKDIPKEICKLLRALIKV